MHIRHDYGKKSYAAESGSLPMNASTYLVYRCLHHIHLANE